MTWSMLPLTMLALGIMLVFVAFLYGSATMPDMPKSARALIFLILLLVIGPLVYWAESDFYSEMKALQIRDQRERGIPIDPRDITDTETCLAVYEGTRNASSCYFKY